MFVSSCTHRAHFLHPFCPHQTLGEKVTKIVLLILGTILLYQTYRLLSKREVKVEETQKERIRQNTIERLKTPGDPLTPSTLFCCFDLFKALQPLEYVRSPSANLENLLEKKVEFERFLAIPCRVTGWTIDHITLFLIEKKANGSYHLEFFDSKGYSIQSNHHANLLKDNLMKLYSITSVTDNARWLQRWWDRYSCGIYICWYLEQRLKGKTAENMPAPDIEAYRTDLAKRLRKECKKP
ncbi:MAG TPA: hypothetical protein VMR37_03835 [Rhabdochlamydiaceae bacterium]|nr:hypothetical protein [Rhabdochlamydiaceae bacterium]